MPMPCLFSRRSRKCYRGVRALADFRRLVGNAWMAGRRMGCGNPLRWFRPQETFSRRAKRAVPDLLRLDVPRLVCTVQVRLMYTELHARSAFSFLEGASLPEELVAVCAEHGMP